MNETLTFQDVMDTLYILYRDRSIRIYGIGALPNVDFSVEDSSVFRDSYNIYLPKDEYTVGNSEEDRRSNEREVWHF